MKQAPVCWGDGLKFDSGSGLGQQEYHDNCTMTLKVHRKLRVHHNILFSDVK